MSKFINAYKAIFAVLTPLGVSPVSVVDALYKAQVIASGRSVNTNSVSGQIIVTISTPNGKGPKELLEFAGKLDAALVGKHVNVDGASIQFYTSGLSGSYVGDNKSRISCDYAIPFQYLQGE